VSVRALQEGDLDQLFAIRQLSFLDRSNFGDEAVRARHAARLPYTFGHFSAGKLTSAAVCFPFEMFLAGRRVRAGGLAGVLSAPEMRRRGFVRALLADILGRLREDGVGWALEYPFDPRFYARYGFASVPNGYEVAAPAEKLFAGAAPDAERVSEDAADRLETIYDAWAQHYSLTLARDTRARPTWSRILEEGRFCYLLPDAYAILELRERNATQTLTVHDYAFASPAGREALWRFIGAFHGQADLIRLHLPADEPLAFDMQRHHSNRVPLLQARITDLGAALGPLVSPSEASFTLRVRDSFCGWNDGTFRVALGPTGSTVTPSQGTPELSLSIGTLTQLVTGALSAAAALRVGLAEGDAGVAHALTALSAERTTFMPSSDYF
jgi:predicted acetyltransferase